MNLQIITPDKKVFEGEAKLVKVPGMKGSFEVLHNHAPIVSILSQGDVKVISPEGQESHFAISGGVVEVKGNKIVLLAEKLLA